MTELAGVVPATTATAEELPRRIGAALRAGVGLLHLRDTDGDASRTAVAALAAAGHGGPSSSTSWRWPTGTSPRWPQLRARGAAVATPASCSARWNRCYPNGRGCSGRLVATDR